MSDIQSATVVQFLNLFSSFSVHLDHFSLERREAVAAMIAFHQRTRHLDKEKHNKKRQQKKPPSDAGASSDPEAITRQSQNDEDKDKTVEEAAEIYRVKHAAFWTNTKKSRFTLTGPLKNLPKKESKIV